jgi:pimeloyl-ACP methyl ester carboxylesterase
MRREKPILVHAQRLHYQASENHDAWDALTEIKSPTLIIHGSEDQINILEEHITLKVIGAGFGRTETMSLEIALEQLDYGPCFHMYTVFDNPAHIPI